MRYLLTAALFFLWLPTVFQGLLYHTYLWQLKEYRLDRMLDFCQTNRRTILRNTLGWLAWSITSLIFPAVGMIGLAGLTGLAGWQFGRHQLYRPVLTGKAILTLAGSVITIALLLLGAVVFRQLWWVLLPGGETFSPELQTLTRVFILLRVLVPLFVALTVGVIYLPSESQKRQIIRQAIARVAAANPQNIIGITGSFGKTSTKTFLATILSAKYPTFSTAGGTNINIAIAQQILRDLPLSAPVIPAPAGLPNLAELQMVVEMAAYTKGEIANICRTAPPNIGIWLAVNEQHLSLFGGIEGTLQAKYELIAALPPDGVAILNGDDPRVMEKCKYWPGRKVIFSVHDPRADVYATDVTVEPEQLRFTVHLRVPRHLYPTPPTNWGGYAEIPPDTLHVTLKTSPLSPNRMELWNSKELVVPVAGKHNLSNLLAAIAAAQETGMDLIEIANSVQKIQSLPGTLAPCKGRKGTVLVDSSYSSNPTGVRAALDYLTIFEGKKKAMLFPGIIELGEESARIHRELGAEIARVCDVLILIKEEFAGPLVEGVLASATPHATNTEVLRNLGDGEILQRLDQLAGPDTVILFEGRGTGRFLEAMKS
mgnify:CR=1 FL=1